MKKAVSDWLIQVYDLWPPLWCLAKRK